MKRIILVGLVVLSSYANAENTSNESMGDSLKYVFKNKDEVINLPVNAVDDGSRLSKDLSKIPKKDEYETSDQYSKRMGSLQKSLYYFIADIENVIESRNLQYLAESQKFVLNKRVSIESSYSSKPTTIKIDLKSTFAEHGSYKAANAYGAKFLVTKMDVIDRKLFISLDPPIDPKDTYKIEGVFGEYPVDAATAKKIRNQLKILYVGSVDLAKVTMSSGFLTPTIRVPWDGVQQEYEIPLTLQGLYLYNEVTHQILSPLSIIYNPRLQ